MKDPKWFERPTVAEDYEYQDEPDYEAERIYQMERDVVAGRTKIY